jgi:hypothetical protein
VSVVLAVRRTSRLEGFAILVLFLVLVVGMAAISLTPSGDPEWAFWVVVPGSLLMACPATVSLLREASRGLHGALFRAQDELLSGGALAAMPAGLLFGLGVRGHRPALLLATLAVVAVLGFGPMAAWQVARRKLPHHGLDLDKWR